ncbi:hypothetical protein PG984_000841 [Apiospora sp. TS-2023a]
MARLQEQQQPFACAALDKLFRRCRLRLRLTARLPIAAVVVALLTPDPTVFSTSFLFGQPSDHLMTLVLFFHLILCKSLDKNKHNNNNNFFLYFFSLCQFVIAWSDSISPFLQCHDPAIPGPDPTL